MKIFFLFILFVSCNSFGTKQRELTAVSYKNLKCKTKALPIKVDYKEEENQISVKITGEGDVSEFQVKDLRGIEGLRVTNSEKPNLRDLAAGEEVEFMVNAEKPEGLSYLVVEVEGKVNQLLKKQILTVPVGKLTTEQKNRRRQNIRRETDKSGVATPGSKSVTTPEERDVHILKIE